MDYYQELGLKPTAAVEEIRQAYKLLARLVHPDGQTDPQLRAMADRQMQRLNDILATLTDEQKRKEYDSTLQVLSAPRVPVPPPDPPPVSIPRPALPHWSRPPVPEPVPLHWRSRMPEWAQTVMQYGFWIVLGTILPRLGCRPPYSRSYQPLRRLSESPISIAIIDTRVAELRQTLRIPSKYDGLRIRASRCADGL